MRCRPTLNLLIVRSIILPKWPGGLEHENEANECLLCTFFHGTFLWRQLSLATQTHKVFSRNSTSQVFFFFQITFDLARLASALRSEWIRNSWVRHFEVACCKSHSSRLCLQVGRQAWTICSGSQTFGLHLSRWTGIRGLHLEALHHIFAPHTRSESSWYGSETGV